MEDVLTVSGLVKRYRRSAALQGVTMRVPRGAIYGLVGKNGAGKTTLFRVICGLQEPTEGEYALYGVPCGERRILEARKRMGAVVETPAIYLDMSAEDNLKQQYRILGLPSFAGIRELLELVGLSDTGHKKAGNFSLGMKQRLGIAVALCGSPDFLILDEPTNGLDPQGIIEMRELILKLNRERQITVLLSSHILDEMSRVATHYGFLDQGRIVQEIDAGSFQGSRRKSVALAVSDTEAASRVMTECGLEYEILSGLSVSGRGEERESRAQGEVLVYGEPELGGLILALAREGCRVHSVQERDESLESYYINLVGGGSCE